MRSAEPPLGACRPSLRLIDCPSLRLIDCTEQAGGKAGECALFAAEGEGVVASLAALTVKVCVPAPPEFF